MSESPPTAVVPIDRREAFERIAEANKVALAEYGADTQRSLESARAANQSGAEAIKAATLINGGAAVAMLAFIGHMASIQAKAVVIMSFAQPLRLFVVGALLGVVASGVTYLSQISYAASLTREFESKEAKRENSEDITAKKHTSSVRWRRIGHVANLAAVLTVAGALFCFGFGCYIAYRAFEAGITPTQVSTRALNSEMSEDSARSYNVLL